jgi:hypothetical protein
MKSYTGIYLGAIFLRYAKKYYLEKYPDGYLTELIGHEKIHGMQVIMCGGLFNFLFIYIVLYLWNLVKYREHWKAYKMIEFEIQARQWEDKF